MAAGFEDEAILHQWSNPRRPEPCHRAAFSTPWIRGRGRRCFLSRRPSLPGREAVPQAPAFEQSRAAQIACFRRETVELSAPVPQQDPSVRSPPDYPPVLFDEIGIELAAGRGNHGPCAGSRRRAELSLPLDDGITNLKRCFGAIHHS